MQRKFSGVFTALVTPFKENSSQIDYASMENLIQRQIAASVKGILILGSTGEAATITDTEKLSIVEFALKIIKKRVPLMVGVNFNDTILAASLAAQYQRLGADVLLVNSPGYNKPSFEGILAHFSYIHEQTKIPIFVYNIPSRSNVDLKNDLLLNIFTQLPRAIGLKDCSGDLQRIPDLRREWMNTVQSKDKQLCLMAGDDDMALFSIINTADGLISTAANVWPAQLAQMVESALAGNYSQAGQIHQKLLFLFKALFIQPNPVMVKYALSKMGLLSYELRLPLLGLKSEHAKLLDDLIEKNDLVSGHV